MNRNIVNGGTLKNKPYSTISISDTNHITKLKNQATDGSNTISYSGDPVICPGQSKLLTPLNVPAGSSFQWFKNGSPTPIATSPTYSATTGGSYSVTVNTGGTLNDYPAVVITEDNVPPVAAFTYTLTDQCSSTAKTFNNTSSGNNLTYLWSFGDPNSGKNNNRSTDKNPNHTFVGTPGNGTQTFTIKLTVTNKGGCTDVYTKDITLNQAPSAVLGGDGATVFDGRDYFSQCSSVPTAFTFTNKSTTDNESYSLFWGDGTKPEDYKSFTTTVSHTYRIGTFTLFYTVTGKNGCSITKRYRVFVGTIPTSPTLTLSNANVCTEDAVTFQVNKVLTNTPGTIYTVTYSDGAVSNYTSEPDTLMHTFFSSSYGKTSTSGGNTYNAVIKASNPCGAPFATLAPIHVSDKPNAEFTGPAGDAVCISNDATFVRTNTTGLYVDGNGNGGANKFVWQISPNTGFIADASKMGNDNNSTDPSTWVSGSDNLPVKFNAAGTYTVILKSGNPNCGIVSSPPRTICVNELPIASFTPSNVEGCVPLTITTTNTSSKPNCGTNIYQWSVKYIDECTQGTSADYTYINGTNAASVEPQFQFNKPGVYTINMTSTAPGFCSSTASPITITVKDKATIKMPPDVALTTKQNYKPTAIVTNCYSTVAPTYLWTFEGASTASSTVSDPDSIMYKVPGNYTITLAVTNECGTIPVTQHITVTQYTPLADIFIPNTFTPNGDGINDTWNILGLENDSSLFLQLFNRYGNLLFERKGNPLSWNGEYKGQKVPAGVYYYLLNNGKQKRSGSVSIIY